MRFVIMFYILCFISCDYYIVNDYEQNVGVISKKNALGPRDFELCFEEKVFPYYYGRQQAKYRPGNDVLRAFIDRHFQNFGYDNESGYITIRFIINCEGRAGRYEIQQVGMDFKKKKFNKALVDHLFSLVQQLQDWQAIEFYGDKYDSFFHIIFKIENGNLNEVLL